MHLALAKGNTYSGTHTHAFPLVPTSEGNSHIGADQFLLNVTYESVDINLGACGHISLKSFH